MNQWLLYPLNAKGPAGHEGHSLGLEVLNHTPILAFLKSTAGGDIYVLSNIVIQVEGALGHDKVHVGLDSEAAFLVVRYDLVNPCTYYCILRDEEPI